LRAAVFGSGLMGSAIARDLVASKNVDHVTVCDVDRARLNTLARAEGTSKLSVKIHDVRRVPETAKLLQQFDVGIGALPYSLTQYAIESTVRAGVNFVDLIFGWRFAETRVHAAAKKKKITIIPACGLAPGLSNILAMAGTETMDRVDEVHIKVGGIPETPKPPLNYRIVFSFEAVLEEYLRKARIVKNGRAVDVPALSGLETIRFPPPIGECECFYTDGLSTLVRTMRSVREMDEKTIRWPGHVAQIQTLIECGLLDEHPVTYDGQPIIPRKFVARTISDRIQLRNEKDLTLLRVDIQGRTGTKRIHQRYQMIDHYDTRKKMTSMARTTAFPCSIAAQLLASGEVIRKGLVPPELAFTQELRKRIMRYLSERGIEITGVKL
jgi:lysine 6-dehydrogenase